MPSILGRLNLISFGCSLSPKHTDIIGQGSNPFAEGGGMTQYSAGISGKILLRIIKAKLTKKVLRAVIIVIVTDKL
jgi:hypothetical protein